MTRSSSGDRSAPRPVPGGPATEPRPIGRHSPRVAWLRRVGRGEEPGLTAVDGVTLVLDLLRLGVRPDSVYVTGARLAALERMPELAAIMAAGRVYSLADETLERAAPTRSPQGVVAVVPVTGREVPVRDVALFLDHLQDPGNVGGIVRCAAAFGAAGVACSPGCADPFSPRAVRGSAGHALLLPVQPGAELGHLAHAFEAAGGEVAAADGRGETTLAAWRPRRPVLLVLGSEGGGLSAGVAERCRTRVRIPLAAGVESLNVAVAAGILLASLAGVAPSPILDVRHIEGGLDDPSQ